MVSVMKIDIVIPTLNRQIKLKNCIESIDKAKHNHNIKLFVYCTNRSDYNATANFLFSYPWASTVLIEEYKVPEVWNTHMRNTTSEVMIYLNDDVLLHEDCIDQIVGCFHNKYPDFDGIIGLNQVNIPDALDIAFGAVGYKYAERFPKKQFFCPDYYRFYGDSEIGEFAKKIDKFYFCADAKITHLHPSLYPEFKDTTHENVRRFLAKDRHTNVLRKSMGLVWGESFQLIEGKQYE